MPSSRSMGRDSHSPTKKLLIPCFMILLALFSLQIFDDSSVLIFKVSQLSSGLTKIISASDPSSPPWSSFIQNPDTNTTAISFQTHPARAGDGPYRNATMGMSYRCPPGDSRPQQLGSLFQSPGLFDFATSINSKLGVLFIGDSVAQQLSEAYDQSLGLRHSWTRHNVSMLSDLGIAYRHLVWGGGGYKETLSFSGPTNGGAFSAYWRITDIWTEKNKNQPLPQATGGGWNDVEVNKLFDRLLVAANRTSFDAVIMNYNNWIIHPEPSIEEKYWDAIALAKEVAKAKAVILVTYPSTRRINTTNFAGWKDIHDTNQMLRNLSYHNNLIPGNPTTVVLEFANFTNQMLWLNARNIGLNVSDPYRVASTYGWELQDDLSLLFQRFRVCAGDGCLHMPMVCAEIVDDRTDCIRNMLSYDDMHWCTETIGARFSAGVACLLGCAFNRCPGDEGNKSVDLGLCERNCNDQFMSLEPVQFENYSYYGSCA